VCYNIVGGDKQLFRGTDHLHLLGSRYPWNQTLRRKQYVSLKGWYPPIRLYHHVVKLNTTIITYTESEKLKAGNVKHKDSWLPDVMPCCWAIRSWHFEGNDQPKSKSKQYSSWTAWTLEQMALKTFPDLHNHYIPERPAQVWTVNSTCTYKVAQSKSKLQHPRTWLTAAWQPHCLCHQPAVSFCTFISLRFHSHKKKSTHFKKWYFYFFRIV